MQRKTQTKQGKNPVRGSECRDISAYACRAMVYGAISGHGISRQSIEDLCRRYCDENPKVDVTQMPIVLATDDGTPENSAVVRLVKRYCRGAFVASEDGRSVILIGPAAKEIVSKLDFSSCRVKKMRTKTRVECGFPVGRRLKCFGGERVRDHLGKTAGKKKN